MAIHFFNTLNGKKNFTVRAKSAEKKKFSISVKIGARGVFKVIWHKFELKIWKFKIADPNGKIYLIDMKISTRKFSWSLIKNLHSEFRNSKFWIQYGGLRCTNWFDWDNN